MSDGLLLDKEEIKNPEKEKDFSNKLRKKLKDNLDAEANNHEVDQKTMLNAVAHAGLSHENLEDFVERYDPNGSE